MRPATPVALLAHAAMLSASTTRAAVIERAAFQPTSRRE